MINNQISLESFIDFCDSMEVAEEGFFKNLFMKRKTKKSKVKSTQTLQNKPKEISPEKEEEIKKKLKEYNNSIYKDIKLAISRIPKSEIQKEMDNSCKDLDDKDILSDIQTMRKSNKSPFEVIIFEEATFYKNVHSCEMIIQVITDNFIDPQWLSSTFIGLARDVCKPLEEKYNCNIDFGDGDEGCLYITFKGLI